MRPQQRSTKRTNSAVNPDKPATNNLLQSTRAKTGSRKDASATSTLSAEMNAEIAKLFRSEGPQPDETAVLIDRDLIEPNPAQPRQRFDSVTLRELGASMKLNGQLQECIVRPHPTLPGRYQLIAGERRWRAAAPEYGAIAQLRCVVRDVDDALALVFAIEENAKREDISPIERARALVNLKAINPNSVSPGRHSTQSDINGVGTSGSKGMTWEEVGQKVGLTRAAIDRLVQLLKLPETVLEKFQQLDLNEKHGRGLLLLKEQPTLQSKLLREIEEQGLSGNQALNRAGKLLAQGQGTEATSSSDNGSSNNANSNDRSNDSTQNRSNSGISTTRSTYNGTTPSDIANRVSDQQDPDRIDPLLSSLKPATAHLTEARRLLSTLKMSADYRRSIRRELDLAESQISDIRKLAE